LLLFAKRSHRDVSSNYWYHNIVGVLGGLRNNLTAAAMNIHNAIVGRYGVAIYEHMNVGSCTVHDGWLYHSANSQVSGSRDRVAIGFSFVSARARVLPELESRKRFLMRRDLDPEDNWSYKEWLRDLKPNDVIDHPMLPLVYDKTNISFVSETHDALKESMDPIVAPPRSKTVSVRAIRKNIPKTFASVRPSPKELVKVRAIRKQLPKVEKRGDNGAVKQRTLSESGCLNITCPVAAVSNDAQNNVEVERDSGVDGWKKGVDENEALGATITRRSSNAGSHSKEGSKVVKVSRRRKRKQ